MPTSKPSSVGRHLRLVTSSDVTRGTPGPAREAALAYTNRRGVTFFLHQGKTKTGKAKYFVAKKTGAGALASMPEGFEFTESINGVVSVRRRRASPGPVSDGAVDLLRAEVARQRHLHQHRVELVRDELVIYEPLGGMSDLELRRLFSLLGTPAAKSQSLQTNRRYEPVMKFSIEPLTGQWLVRRMSYRGPGGWSHALEHGTLASLAKRFVPALGTEGFFELF